MLRLFQKLFIVIIFPACMSAQYQQSIFGVACDMSSSGNGHGSFYIPSLTLTGGRSTVLFGMLVHKRSTIANGYRLGYTFNLSGDPEELFNGPNFDLLQINIFGYVQYNQPLSLSYRAECVENKIQREPQVNWSKKFFATLETTLGMELRLNISSRFAWRNYVGMSLYKHVSGFENVPRMYHQKQGLTLCIGTGIHYFFLKK